MNLDAAIVQIPGPAGHAGLLRRALGKIAVTDALHSTGDEESPSAYTCHVFLDYYVLTLNPELALIFDLDGVVVDSMPTHTLAWERYLEANGIDPLNVEARMHGKRNDDLVRDLFGTHLGDAEIFEHGAAKERLFREIIGTTLQAKLVPGIREFVEEASKTVPLAVGTNAEPANVDFILNGAGIRQYFRAIVDGSQVARAKPAPDVYLRGAELMGVEPAHCIVFEDSPVGIQAARAAGMRVVGLLTHAVHLENVDVAVPDFVHPELETWLSAQLAIAKSRR
jgi:beta-phosphoglucomutase